MTGAIPASATGDATVTVTPTGARPSTIKLLRPDDSSLSDAALDLRRASEDINNQPHSFCSYALVQGEPSHAFQLPRDCDLLSPAAPGRPYVPIIVRFDGLPHPQGVITDTKFTLQYDSGDGISNQVTVPEPFDFPTECVQGSLLEPLAIIYGPQAVVLLPWPVLSPSHTPKLGQPCMHDVACAAEGVLACIGGTCGKQLQVPLAWSLAHWIRTKAMGMQQGMQIPSSFTVGCGAMQGYEGGVDLLDAELTMATNMGCNVVDLQNFGTDAGGPIPPILQNVPGQPPNPGTGIPDDVLACIMRSWSTRGIQARSWDAGHLAFTTGQHYGGQQVRVEPQFDFDYWIPSNGAIGCWGPNGGCSIAALFEGERQSFHNSNHVFESPRYFLHGDEITFFYPDGNTALPYPLLPASQENPSSELDQQLTAFHAFLQANSVLLADLGAGNIGDVHFPEPLTNLWFTCRTHAPDNSPAGMCGSMELQSWITTQLTGHDRPQKKLLYWTMEFLQYSYARAAATAHGQSRMTFPGGGLVLDAVYTRSSQNDFFPFRMYDSAETQSQDRVQLSFDWKRIGQVADIWAEYHYPDWMLNSYDFQAALQRSALISSLQCVGPLGSQTCRTNQMGGDIVLGASGNGLDATPPMSNDNRYRFLSLIGHGASVLQLFNLGPKAFDANGWSDNAENARMASAMSVVKNSERILLNATADPAATAIVLPPWSSRLWLDSSDYARYDQEVAGLYLALAYNGVNVDFIDDRDISALLFTQYRTIYVVAPNLSRTSQQLLRDFAMMGGVLALTPGAATSNEFGDFTTAQDRAIYAAYFDQLFPGQEMDWDGKLDAIGADAQRRDPFPLGPRTSPQDPSGGMASIDSVPIGGGPVAWTSTAVVDQDGKWPFLPAAEGFPFFGLTTPGDNVQAARNAPAILVARPFYSPGAPMLPGGTVLFYQYYPGSSYLHSGAGGQNGVNPLTTVTVDQRDNNMNVVAQLLPKGWDYHLATLAAVPTYLAGSAWPPQVLVEEVDNQLAHNIITSPAQGIEALTWRNSNGIAIVLLNFGGRFWEQQSSFLRVTVPGIWGQCPTMAVSFAATDQAPPPALVGQPDCSVPGQAILIFDKMVDANVLLLTFGP